MTEALNLLKGELLSVGLAVTVQERSTDPNPAGPQSRRWLEELAASGASAVVETVDLDAGLAVDVWVVKTQPLRFEVTRASVDPDTPKAAEVLALRAVEALRGGLLLIDRPLRRQQQEPIAKSAPVVASGDTEHGPAQHRERFGLGAGAAALASLDGVGPAFSPMVQVSWAATSWMLVQASLAGAGTRPTVTTPGGTVQVAQHYGTAGPCFRLRLLDGRLWPFVTVAVGGLYSSVAGRTDAVNEGRTVDQWSFLLDGGLGAGLRVYRRFYTALSAHVQLAAPYVAVHMVDAVGATTGRPNLGLTLTFGAWL